MKDIQIFSIVYSVPETLINFIANKTTFHNKHCSIMTIALWKECAIGVTFIHDRAILICFKYYAHI